MRSLFVLILIVAFLALIVEIDSLHTELAACRWGELAPPEALGGAPFSSP